MVDQRLAIRLTSPHHEERNARVEDAARQKPDYDNRYNRGEEYHDQANDEDDDEDANTEQNNETNSPQVPSVLQVEPLPIET